MNNITSRPPLIVDLWRRTPAELGYLLLGLPIAVAGLVVCITMVSLGVSLAVFTVGLFVLVGALLAARAFGRLERTRLRRAGRPEIASPVWPMPDRARGVMWRTLTPLLREEVATLAASRGAAVQAEDRSLRRLERDIHDGPQQRLVRLQMDLAAAERRLTRDPEAAGVMLTEARTQAHDAFEELRALSRGFAPPILQDRGLIAGLRSLAERSPIPVALDVAMGDDAVFAPEVERSVYFVAAELLTNIAKHSGARSASMRLDASMGTAVDGSAATVGTRSDAGAIAVAVTRELVLQVRDTGVGGAVASDGHGLAGLAERLHGLRGQLEVDSPVGGPTTVTARVPLASL